MVGEYNQNIFYVCRKFSKNCVYQTQKKDTDEQGATEGETTDLSLRSMARKKEAMMPSEDSAQ